MDKWLADKHSHVFHQVSQRYSYLRQFSPAFIEAIDLQAQRNTSSCLTLIMACIIYWQAKEISRVIQEYNLQDAKIDISLLKHISPIGWENVILYGESILNRSLIQV